MLEEILTMQNINDNDYVLYLNNAQTNKSPKA